MNRDSGNNFCLFFVSDETVRTGKSSVSRAPLFHFEGYTDEASALKSDRENDDARADLLTKWRT